MFYQYSTVARHSTNVSMVMLNDIINTWKKKKNENENTTKQNKAYIFSLCDISLSDQ